jgi:flagellar secretion chaperone FliS
MKRKDTELSYLRLAIEGASPIGLMIVLFDLLANDLRRAARALRTNDIETRCKEFNHAFLVLGQLQSWVDLERGGESAKILVRFYDHLRAKTMEAGVTKSANILEKQIDTILQVRTAWQEFDLPHEASTIEATAIPSAPLPGTMAERVPFSQSA